MFNGDGRVLEGNGGTGMSCVLEYKALHGKIEGINDLVDFDSENAREIENEFHAAVDDYLEFCAELGKTPEKEDKGLM